MMAGHRKITDAQRDEIRALRNDDRKRWTHGALGARFGVSDTTILRVLHPEFDNRKTGKAPTLPEMPSRVRKRIEADAELLAHGIPPDTRDLTGQIMGDPRIGRRALDKRMGNAG